MLINTVCSFARSVRRLLASVISRGPLALCRETRRLNCEALEDRVVPAAVGYYDMGLGQGDWKQALPIEANAHTPVQLFNLTAADLEGLDVLMVQNSSNGGYGGEYVTHFSAIVDAVNDGMVLVFHDRTVHLAGLFLPGGAPLNMVRDFSQGQQIDVLDPATLLANGPAGAITNTSLDGYSFSNHGYALGGTLPEGAHALLSTDDPNHIVTFSWEYGKGNVLYSSVPLDFHLAKPNNISSVYGPNVVAYAVDLLDAEPPVADAGEDVSTLEGSEVAFSANTSQATDGTLTYHWDFGDGHTLDGMTATHTFADDGVYTVTLTVIDAKGNIGTDTLEVSVENVAPLVIADGGSAAVRGQHLVFSGSFVDPGEDDWFAEVDLGDGSPPQPLTLNEDGSFAFEHAWKQGGVYSVIVTVRDDDGAVGVWTQEIVVSTVMMQSDPDDPSRTWLVVGGTEGDDRITFVSWGWHHEKVRVFLNGQHLGVFAPTAGLKAYGQAGNDVIFAASSRLSVYFDGGVGNDRLVGGFADDTLLGGPGRDTLQGSWGNDVLDGGKGRDRLFGGWGRDQFVNTSRRDAVWENPSWRQLFCGLLSHRKGC